MLDLNKGGSVKDLSDTCKRATSKSYKRSKKGVVYFVTSDKVIQAIMTASAFAVVAASVETVSLAISAMTGVHPIVITLIGMVGVFYISLWIDNNTERWREMVETATGEEAADDEVDEGE